MIDRREFLGDTPYSAAARLEFGAINERQAPNPAGGGRRVRNPAVAADRVPPR